MHVKKHLMQIQKIIKFSNYKQLHNTNYFDWFAKLFQSTSSGDSRKKKYQNDSNWIPKLFIWIRIYEIPKSNYPKANGSLADCALNALNVESRGIYGLREKYYGGGGRAHFPDFTKHCSQIVFLLFFSITGLHVLRWYIQL